MAKRLSDIAFIVENSASSFLDYLKRNLTNEAFEIIERISQETEVYVFSGVIRNFFLKSNEVRDIDLILNDEINIELHFTGFEIKRNSYGGFKLIGNNTIVDLWYLKTTWALQHQPIFNFDMEKYIPSTAFFNFSSILFSFSQKRFYPTIHFLRFLRDKKIDVVYKPSANYSLCIINSFYYCDKYNLKLADRLRRHIIRLSKVSGLDFETVQQKHFGKIIYSSDEILRRIFFLKTQTRLK